MDYATYYEQLEEGARYLASTASSDAERQEHLGWANRYSRLALECRPTPVPSRPAPFMLAPAV